MAKWIRKPGRLCWLQTDYVLPLPHPGRGGEDAWVSLAEQHLLVRSGFAWDGPWPLPRLRCLLRASLVHDALYHLMRAGKIPWCSRQFADAVFRKLAVEDGAPPWLAAVCYWAVRGFGGWRARADWRRLG